MKAFSIIVKINFKYLESHNEVYYTEEETAEAAKDKVSKNIESIRSLIAKSGHSFSFLPFEIVAVKELKKPLDTYKKMFKNHMGIMFVE